jgi:hypothetical protein
MGSTVSPTDAGGHFNHTSTFDLTGKHIFHWRQIVTAGNMSPKASKGISIGLTNTNTTSQSAWSTTNYKIWYLDGNDTVPLAKGWVPYVLDPSSTADLSAGTLTLSSVKNVGMICRQVSSVTTTVSNQFYDAIRMGTGLTATASSSADIITFASIYSVDNTNTNAWGILTRNAGAYYASAKMTFGSSSQTNTCLAKDTDGTLTWLDQRVSSDLYTFTCIGNATYKTTRQFGEKDGSGNTSLGYTIEGESGKTWGWSLTNADLKFYASKLKNIRSGLALSPGSEILDTTISSSGTIALGGATISRCQFIAPTATQFDVASASELSLLTNSRFTSSGTGHALRITAVGDYTANALTFNNYASSNGSTGNEAVFVDVASGTVNIAVTNGGNTPSYRTAGATVNVTNSKSKTFTGLPAGTEVRVRRGSKTLATDGNVTTGSYVYSYTPDDKAVMVQFTLPGYVFEDISVVLNSTSQELPVTSAPDPSYSAT